MSVGGKFLTESWVSEEEEQIEQLRILSPLSDEKSARRTEVSREGQRRTSKIWAKGLAGGTRTGTGYRDRY